MARANDNTAFTPSSADYLLQLHHRVNEVEAHFAQFFGSLIVRDLRRRIRSPELIEDIRQETLLRVLVAVRTSERKLKNPERFVAYVMGVCNNVRRELTRAESRHIYSCDDYSWLPDGRPSVETEIALKQLQSGVRRALRRIPEKGHNALSMVCLEERPRLDVCEQLGVDDSYLRVMLHRAKSQFRRRYQAPTVSRPLHLATATCVKVALC